MTLPGWIRRPGLAAATVVGVALLVGLASMTPWLIGSYYDDGTYTMLAKSIATGHGYRYLNLPGHPVATHYPPGYPLFLAALWTLWPEFPANTALFKLANAGLLAVVTLAVYLLCRRALGWRPWAAAAVAMVGTLTPAMLVLSSALMSEMLFLAMLIPALVLAERLVREPGSWRRPLLIGVLMGATLMVRSIGLPAVGALLLLLALRRRWRDAAIVGASVLAFMLPWAIWTRTFDALLPGPLFSSYGSYGVWVGQGFADRGSGFLLEVVRVNLMAHAMYFGDHFMPVPGKLASQVAFVGFVIAMLAGAWWLRRRLPVTLLFIFGYSAMLLLWAFQPDRFYYAMEPFSAIVLVGATLAAIALWRDGRRGRRWGGAALGGIMLLLATGFVRDSVVGLTHRRWERVQRERHEALADIIGWVRTETPRDAVIAVEADPMLYLYTGRTTVPLITMRASYYVQMPKYDSPLLYGDTRYVIGHYRPDFVVMRGSLAEPGSVVVRSFNDLPVRVHPRARFGGNGAVVEVEWLDSLGSKGLMGAHVLPVHESGRAPHPAGG
jgi:hypothetical protein